MTEEEEGGGVLESSASGEQDENIAQQQQQQHDYVFGFGSIINTATHAPWIAELGDAGLKGQRANIEATFGYKRGWNFRSNTGFTALGVTKADEKGEGEEQSAAAATAINGVMFRIRQDMLPGFDRREVGYDRVELPMEHVQFIPPDTAAAAAAAAAAAGSSGGAVALNIQPHEKMWVYIQQPSFCAEANEDHPILQSYVDTVMQGCLEWGGESMASEFVATTGHWSPFFLNDTPSSRRPWLFRKEYNTIDRILSRNPSTHFADRRHPEEFASAFLIKMMRGTWSVPRRNTAFTGRDGEIGQIHARMLAQRTTDQFDTSGSTSTSVAKLEVAGMGGVGKTQLCTEYCYRYFPSYYGLVIWLSAQGAESIAACYRQLMADTTGVVDVQAKDTDEVVAEVKARLFRSKVPWLLVFDNLEDRSLLDKFVPHGSTCGHVLVTTRLMLEEPDVVIGDQQTLVLGCFSPSESVELLCRSAKITGKTHVAAANQLADQLGHLPLALSMAAAYMRRCDVDCSEYLARYVASERSGGALALGHQSVSSSLSLSLNAIKSENLLAWELLRLLGWLGPDQITKGLIRSLLRARQAQADAEAKASADLDAIAKRNVEHKKVLLRAAGQTALLGGVALCANLVMGRQATTGRRRHVRTGINLLTAIAIPVALTRLVVVRKNQAAEAAKRVSSENQRSSSTSTRSSYSSNVFEDADAIWRILKSFSLLVVKDAKGSMHRLLAQALRNSQAFEDEGMRNLRICVLAIGLEWKFKPEQVDTWQDSARTLEHLKAVITHSSSQPEGRTLEIAVLAREAGVFSAMALNRFEEAKSSFEESLQILGEDSGNMCKTYTQARASAMYELGRVLRYQGSFQQSEEALQTSLALRNQLSRNDLDERRGVASTLYELGVLEVKKHNLDSAVSFLEQALELRRTLEVDSTFEGIEAECAAALHQLAAAHVARKPPALDNAEALLQEALGLNMQIGQRAATLKQLARVAIRRGEFQRAECSLAQALELYVELYGETTLHINVAAVKFQQGALAFQCEQYEQAWEYYSECLRARRHVYGYLQGNHLEVSAVQHELARVAFALNRIVESRERLLLEKGILSQLCESSHDHQRMLQARLTNLTWLRKCAKEVGDEEEVRKVTTERSDLKKGGKQQTLTEAKPKPDALLLQRELLHCRSVARKFALSGCNREDEPELREALTSMIECSNDISQSAIQSAAMEFHGATSEALVGKNIKGAVLKACDRLRDVLREHGMQISDTAKIRP